jgi:hypothetical protein
MRPEDVAECEAAGLTPFEALSRSVELSEVAVATFFQGELGAIWGAGPVDLPGEGPAGMVWMLSGPAVAKRRKDFLRECRRAVERLLERHEVLFNFVDSRYLAALRWAKWLGFEVGPAEAAGDGIPFHRIVLRRSAWAR